MINNPFQHRRYKTYKILGYSTSEKEINDLFKSWLIISISFALILWKGKIFSIGFVQGLIISAIAVGTGFIFHEIAHKVVAQRFGCFAEFRANMSMLIFALFLAFITRNFVFAAPGAVMISGYVNQRLNGKISIAGPLTNLVLAVLFLLLGMWSSYVGFEFLGRVFGYGFMINTWIGLFNLIPFGNFDGIKILNWNRVYYGLIVGFGLGLFMLQMV